MILYNSLIIKNIQIDASYIFLYTIFKAIFGKFYYSHMSGVYFIEVYYSYKSGEFWKISLQS